MSSPWRPEDKYWQIAGLTLLIVAAPLKQTSSFQVDTRYQRTRSSFQRCTTSTITLRCGISLQSSIPTGKYPSIPLGFTCTDPKTQMGHTRGTEQTQGCIHTFCYWSKRLYRVQLCSPGGQDLPTEACIQIQVHESRRRGCGVRSYVPANTTDQPIRASSEENEITAKDGKGTGWLKGVINWRKGVINTFTRGPDKNVAVEKKTTIRILLSDSCQASYFAMSELFNTKTTNLSSIRKAIHILALVPDDTLCSITIVSECSLAPKSYCRAQ